MNRHDGMSGGAWHAWLLVALLFAFDIENHGLLWCVSCICSLVLAWCDRPRTFTGGKWNGC